MADGTGERGSAHDEHAGAHGGFQLIPQHGGKHQQHHHTAARAHKAADKAHHRTAKYRAYRFLSGGGGGKTFFGFHHRFDNKLNAQQQRHKNGEIAHGRFGYHTGDIAAHHCETQHRQHHNQSVFDVEIFVFAVCVS